jgi:hypothetical protein
MTSSERLKVIVQGKTWVAHDTGKCLWKVDCGEWRSVSLLKRRVADLQRQDLHCNGSEMNESTPAAWVSGIVYRAHTSVRQRS